MGRKFCYTFSIKALFPRCLILPSNGISANSLFSLMLKIPFSDTPNIFRCAATAEMWGDRGTLEYFISICQHNGTNQMVHGKYMVYCAFDIVFSIVTALYVIIISGL